MQEAKKVAGRMIDTYVSKVKPAPEHTRPSKSGKAVAGSGKNDKKSACAAAM